ncbi:MAG: (deoxy)nucleoside triphosphate pyrophosphohydrolase [Candidatus Cryptobacteroides sp.]|jgi:8-oxo-dGTP diphosphatase
MERKSIEVVAAVIREGNRILATQRGYGDFKDFWEFPGGKMEPGETREAALKREIEEELKTEITIERLLATVDHDYPDFHITLHCFLCRVQEDHLTLTEHEAAKWLDAGALDSVNWLPADRSVIELLKDQI